MMNYVLMFVPDKDKALKEVERVLKPGGRAYLSVWKNLPMYDITHDTMEKIAAKQLPEFGINPLALKGEQALEKYIGKTKLEVVSSETITYDFNFESLKDFREASLILS